MQLMKLPTAIGKLAPALHLFDRSLVKVASRRNGFTIGAVSMSKKEIRMNMTPRFQKFTLLAHITFSVGWFGAVVPYLALAIAGLG
jgi:hypothetical protein